MKFYTTKVFQRNYLSKKTIVLNKGGARSSKSFSLIQLLMMRFINYENLKILIVRKTKPSLRITVLKQFIDTATTYGFIKSFSYNKTNLTLEYKSNYILFTSIDDPTKFQSTEFNYIWLEEAEEFTYEDFIVLKTRLSGAAVSEELTNQIYLTYNPKRRFSYIATKLEKQKDVEIIESSYKDNPFLSQNYIQLLQGLKDTDENFYKIFALGQYADMTGLILNNIETIKKESYPKTKITIYGIDFGFNNPTALLRCDILNDTIYVTELLYKSGLINSEVIKELKRLNVKSRIYADNAEPARIKEIKNNGFDILPASKSNMEDSLNFIKNFKIKTCDENINFNKEAEEYYYKKDNQGKSLEIPIKYNDHLLDALRYAVYTHLNKNKINIRIA